MWCSRQKGSVQEGRRLVGESGRSRAETHCVRGGRGSIYSIGRQRRVEKISLEARSSSNSKVFKSLKLEPECLNLIEQRFSFRPNSLHFSIANEYLKKAERAQKYGGP